METFFALDKDGCYVSLHFSHSCFIHYKYKLKKNREILIFMNFIKMRIKKCVAGA